MDRIFKVKSGISKTSVSGFTLVEILVALSILTIVAAVSIPNLRRFNDTQALENTTNDLVRVLREAQSSANSRVGCTDTLIAREWVIRIEGSSYQLRANCYNPSSAGLPPPSEVRYQPDPAVMAGITISTRTPSASCTLPTQVVFSAEYKPFDQNRFSNISYDCSGADSRMEIDLRRDTSHIRICLDKGGAIYASPNVCF